jgi:hypothetical protein
MATPSTVKYGLEVGSVQFSQGPASAKASSHRYAHRSLPDPGDGQAGSGLAPAVFGVADDSRGGGWIIRA